MKKAKIRKTQKEIETKIKIETKKTDNHQNYNKKNNKKKRKRKSRKKEKIRRSNKVKNTLKDFKIFYQNVRWLKSKIDALDEVIDGYQPNLICLVETHLAKEEQIGILEYRIYRNDGTKNSKGILIAVKIALKPSAEVSRYDKVGQTLWILLNNQRQKIRVGVIYGPQENVTPNNSKRKISTSTYGRRFQCKDRKPYSRQQRNNVKRRTTAQKNHWEV